MPNKGLFTQGIVILLGAVTSISKIEESLINEFNIVKKTEQSESWEFGGPSLIISFRPEVNGYISVDVVDRPWPDGMGDPKLDSMVFGAWSLGHFGPFAYPGNLQRASQQCWKYPHGKSDAELHKAFIRIRVSYIFGHVDKNTLCIPAGYDAMAEMLFISKLARKLLDIPEALCYFNPNGEILASAQEITELLERHSETGLPPLELWSNIRMFTLPDNDEWALMDSVGMQQLDSVDQEALFEEISYDANEVANFLRNVSDYLLENGPVIKAGDTIDGPGNIRWQGITLEDGISSPPRAVIRWFPMDNRTRPSGYQGEGKRESENAKKQGFFSRLFNK